MKMFFIICAVFSGSFCKADETDAVYVIDDKMLVAQNGKGAVGLNPGKVEAAKKLRECLSASEFREGGFGKMTLVVLTTALPSTQA